MIPSLWHVYGRPGHIEDRWGYFPLTIDLRYIVAIYERDKSAVIVCESGIFVVPNRKDWEKSAYNHLIECWITGVAP